MDDQSKVDDKTASVTGATGARTAAAAVATADKAMNVVIATSANAGMIDTVTRTMSPEQWARLLVDTIPIGNTKQQYPADHDLTATTCNSNVKLSDLQVAHLEWSRTADFSITASLSSAVHHDNKTSLKCRMLVGTADVGLWVTPKAAQTLQLSVTGVRMNTRHGPTLQLSSVGLVVPVQSKSQPSRRFTVDDVRLLPPCLLQSSSHCYGIIGINLLKSQQLGAVFIGGDTALQDLVAPTSSAAGQAAPAYL